MICEERKYRAKRYIHPRLISKNLYNTKPGPQSESSSSEGITRISWWKLPPDENLYFGLRVEVHNFQNQLGKVRWANGLNMNTLSFI